MTSEAPALRWEFHWDSSRPGANAAALTSASLCLWVGGRLIWGKREGAVCRGFRWTWIDLLEHLSVSWSRLVWEQADPLGFPESRPDLLRGLAETSWQNLPPQERDSQEAALWSFEEAHDLARGVQGAWPAAVWLLREGRSVWVRAGETRLRCPFEEVFGQLSALGDEIAARLESSSDPRAGAALSAWHQRAERPSRDLVRIATGLPQETLDVISGKAGLEQAFELQQGFDDTELVAAARMTARSQDSATIRTLVSRLKKEPRRETPALDALAEEAGRLVARGDASQPHESGYELARWLRRRLELEERVEPETLIRGWGVGLGGLGLQTRSIDAVCCWGKRHGPAVLVNASGKHAQGAAGRRATLAHEISHLLLDRNDALPLAEVLGGQVPYHLEARARAFAAELLLPRDEAGRVMANAADPQAALASLQRRFGVSQEIVAWQALNSQTHLPEATTRFLRERTSARRLLDFQL